MKTDPRSTRTVLFALVLLASGCGGRDAPVSQLDGGTGPDVAVEQDVPLPGVDRPQPGQDQIAPSFDAPFPAVDRPLPSRDMAGRVPLNHRPVPVECDRVRDPSEPSNLPPETDGGFSPVSCRSNAECTEGINGRCIGNGHDGWYCSYDDCFTDGECSGAGGICQCAGGFRSDANVCVTGGCRVDGDCGPGGYCSPSFGSCGSFSGVVGYYCHTAQDECLDDADCGAAQPGTFGQPYCAYDPAIGRWACSTQECAG